MSFMGALNILCTTGLLDHQSRLPIKTKIPEDFSLIVGMAH
jgi:hypothetical protein